MPGLGVVTKLRNDSRIHSALALHASLLGQEWLL